MKQLIETLKGLRKTLINKEQFDIKLGELVQEKRSDLGITATDLAKISGISYQRLNRFESGAGNLFPYEVYVLFKFLVISSEDFNKELIRDNNSKKIETDIKHMYNRRQFYIGKLLSIPDNSLKLFIELTESIRNEEK